MKKKRQSKMENEKWREREEDVCGKKEGNGEMGKMGTLPVCGKK